MANNDKENKIKKFTKEAIGKTLNQFNKEIGMADLVEINKNQDRILNGILFQVNDENTEKTEKSNIITLDNSTDGIVELKEIQGDTNVNVSKIEEMPITHDIGDKEGNIFNLNEIPKGAISIGEIQGNTMVNCNKDDKKELVLMKDLSTQGYSNVTLTEGVDGGLVDVALEGNTMVNVCNQKDPVAITKGYTVETGNHVALQGEYDGKCRPVVTGNTLWIDNATEEVLTAFDATKNLRLQSSFEDKVVTQEMVDVGEELAENLGKYRVDYKVTGKNKCKEKVTAGFITASGLWNSNNSETKSFIVKLNPGLTYTITKTGGDRFSLCSLDHIPINGEALNILYMNNTSYTSTITLPNSHNYLIVYVASSANTDEVQFQIEEGGVATSYEPYKEYKKTFYLNSSLLQGDIIEQQGNNVVHVHRYKEVVLDGSENWAYIPSSNAPTNTDYTIFTLITEDYKVKGDIISSNIPVPERKYITANYPNIFAIGGHTANNQIRICIEKSKLPTPSLNSFKTWLQQNPTTVVYELQTPQYEVISQNDTILCDSYVNGHLDVDSVVPIEKVVFNNRPPFILKYLYQNTSYIVQFESDNTGKVDTIRLGDALIRDINIIKGINKFTLTTADLSSFNNALYITGIGFNASNIVVTEATDQDFGYFEGMKSVGECEDLEVVSCGFEGVHFTVDMLEKGIIGDLGHTQSSDIGFRTKDYVRYPYKYGWVSTYNTKYLCRGIHCYDINKNWLGKVEKDCPLINGTYYIKTNFRRDDSAAIEGILEDMQFNITNTKINYVEKIKSNTQTLTHEPLRAVGDIKDKYVLIDGKWYIERNCGVRAYQEGDKDNYITDKINTVYPLSTPQYEPIDYNPFEVYSDITHISNNSTIPCNMTIKNTGYNCLLKPSTTYTVSSNLGLNTVTTPSTLTEDCLRFMDTDTSDVTTMKDVLILEGDWTTKANLIPSNFSGIESAFEQEYDAEKGKYKVNIKVANEDKSQENNITFYINEPLRGVEGIKDKVFIKDDKVVVQRNCGSVTFDGSADEKISLPGANEGNSIEFRCSRLNIPHNSKGCICNNFIKIDSLWVIDKEGFVGFNNALSSFDFRIQKIKLQTPDVNGFRQWLQQNPTTVVYQLAEPTYEEVEYSSNRLILDTFNNESFNNSTLFLDTNISPKLSFKPLYEELVYVKSNTKYYIQFNAVGSGEVVINLGGTELTTEIVEGYNCIPITTPNESTNLMVISGQGITISEVVVSEVICGGHYKGLQSCFEEHIENGKYRVLLRGIALDGSKVNGIKLYINEPLRGVEDTRDRLCIKNGKLMVERKCSSVILGCTGNIWDTTERGASSGKTIEFRITAQDKLKSGNPLCDKFKKPFYNLWTLDEEGIYIYETDGVDIRINKCKLSTPDVDGFKQWLQANPVTVVYQLAEPTYEEATNEYGLPIVFEGYENGIVYIDSAVTPTTHIKYTSNNQLATTLSEAEEQNIATQEDINMNVVTYMMDIDMILTEMEMSNDTSVMAVRRDSSNENMLDRMSEEDKKVYRDNTVVMLEKMITANVLEKEDIEGRINMYYNKNRISKEQYEYLKSLL